MCPCFRHVGRKQQPSLATGPSPSKVLTVPSWVHSPSQTLPHPPCPPALLAGLQASPRARPLSFIRSHTPIYRAPPMCQAQFQALLLRHRGSHSKADSPAAFHLQETASPSWAPPPPLAPPPSPAQNWAHFTNWDSMTLCGPQQMRRSREGRWASRKFRRD